MRVLLTYSLDNVVRQTVAASSEAAKCVMNSMPDAVLRNAEEISDKDINRRGLSRWPNSRVYLPPNVKKCECGCWGDSGWKCHWCGKVL